MLKFNAEKYPEVRPWVATAITEESKRLGKPLWENAPSIEDVYLERLRRVKFMRKHAPTYPRGVFIADRLDRCEIDAPCFSGACPECGRLFQRSFVRKAGSFIDTHLDGTSRELVAMSIILPKPIIRPGELHKYSIVNVQRRLRHALKHENVPSP
jgi:hypothetical protein